MAEKMGRRTLAWRNLMIAAVNAGLEQRLFGLEPGANHWPGEITHGRRDAFVFRFVFPGGLNAIASVGDAGWDELSVHVAVEPTPQAEGFVLAGNAGFHAGNAFASGWLERRNGRWLQTSGHPLFKCRKRLIDVLGSMKIEAHGFLDHGKVMM